MYKACEAISDGSLHLPILTELCTEPCTMHKEHLRWQYCGHTGKNGVGRTMGPIISCLNGTASRSGHSQIQKCSE